MSLPSLLLAWIMNSVTTVTFGITTSSRRGSCIPLQPACSITVITLSWKMNAWELCIPSSTTLVLPQCLARHLLLPLATCLTWAIHFFDLLVTSALNLLQGYNTWCKMISIFNICTCVFLSLFVKIMFFVFFFPSFPFSCHSFSHCNYPKSPLPSFHSWRERDHLGCLIYKILTKVCLEKSAVHVIALAPYDIGKLVHLIILSVYLPTIILVGQDMAKVFMQVYTHAYIYLYIFISKKEYRDHICVYI